MDKPNSDQSSFHAETYTPGYTTNASSFMAQRSAESHAAFFLPHLSAGMNLLDCGCGPGTITTGFLPIVVPGQVVGLDIAESQIALAKDRAAQQRLANIDFKVGSVYELPFGAGTFNAVFAHAVMEHLKTPLNAFQELRRVLAPGGVAGVCSPDWGGFIVAPSTPTLVAAINFYKRLQEHNGGNPYVGRQLGVLAQQAGFSRLKITAYYECYENLASIAEYLALRIKGASAEELAKVKRPDDPAIADMVAAMRVLGNRSDGLFAQSWVAVIAWNGQE